MSEKYFKIMIVLFFGFAITTMCVGILQDGESENFDVNVTQTIPAAEGLDLKAVGALLKDAKDPQSFETALNDPSTGINNLDLDQNGKVDYINVTEYGAGNERGFSLTVDLDKGDTQEVANIKIEKDKDGNAQVQAKGNPQVYGENHYYNTSWQPGFGTGLLMGYLFAPHANYRSPFGYGNYPQNYGGGYNTSNRDDYNRRIGDRTKDSSFTRGRNNKMLGSTASPYENRNSNRVKAPLRNPTSSQKSFQSKSKNRSEVKSRSGGFGRSSSVRSSSRSGGSFGGK